MGLGHPKSPPDSTLQLIIRPGHSQAELWILCVTLMRLTYSSCSAYFHSANDQPPLLLPLPPLCPSAGIICDTTSPSACALVNVNEWGTRLIKSIYLIGHGLDLTFLSHVRIRYALAAYCLSRAPSAGPPGGGEGGREGGLGVTAVFH